MISILKGMVAMYYKINVYDVPFVN